MESTNGEAGFAFAPGGEVGHVVGPFDVGGFVFEGFVHAVYRELSELLFLFREFRMLTRRRASARGRACRNLARQPR